MAQQEHDLVTSMQRHDHVRLQHMIDSTRSAQSFAQGRSRSDLDSDEMLLFALVRAVEIVGEAASRLSAEARAELPHVSWHAVIGGGPRGRGPQ